MDLTFFGGQNTSHGLTLKLLPDPQPTQRPPPPHLQSTVAFLSLVLVSGLNTAAEFQANPPKYSYNLRKRKKRRGSSIQEEPTVSYGHTNKRKRRQWPPPGQVYQTKDER